MSEDDDKQHAPSQRRLDEARKRGEIPRSVDITVATSYGGLLIALLAGGQAMVLALGQIGAGLIDRSDQIAPLMSAGAQPILGPLLINAGLAAAPLFALPALAVMLALVAQRGIVFAPQKLALRLSRISPLANARHKFGLDGLFEFGKSFIKLSVISTLIAAHLWSRSAEIVTSLDLSAAQATGLMLRIVVEFLFLLVLFSASVGGGDYLWAHMRHLRRNRMSRQELTEEMKDTDGDPHVKGQRRQRGQEIAMNRMLRDVATADVIIVNPTHYAVALRWKRTDQSAPICVAKGVDEIAARIRERAVMAGVPLHSDPPTARALHASVDIGHPILPAHYKPVAAAIRFAEALRRRGLARP